MKEEIRVILEKLELQSQLEKSDKVQVERDEQMLAISKETGEFYNIILRATKAKKILEIGTSAGYSTLWFADAIIENNGKILTIEQSSSKIQRAKQNFENAGVINNIEIIQGHAIKKLQEIANQISNTDDKFDFVFLDADKENNIKYFDLILPMVKVGGIIATDNMLYPEHFRPEMKKFLDHIKSKPNVQTITLKLGNGEEISIKTG